MAGMRYKNTSDEEQDLIGFGLVKPGQTVESEEGIKNPNFARVTDTGLPPMEPKKSLKKGKK